MPLREAASIADRLLTDNRLFRCVAKPSDDTQAFTMFAPELKRVLRRYESIEQVEAPGGVITRSAIGPSARMPGLLKIGVISPASDGEGEVSVEPGAETVYELHAAEIDREFGTYTNIYHWLIAMAEESTQSRGKAASTS